MSKKILVTGATGHVGANVVRRLLTDAEDVRVLVRPGDATDAFHGLAVERVEGDLRDASAVGRAVQGTGRVFHVAAIVSTVSGTAAHRQAIFETNVLGTKHVLEAALSNGVERVVVTSSFSAVGYDPNDPTLPSNEEMPFDPFRSPTPYSTSKAAAEHECWKAAARGLDVVVAVSCAVVGGNDFIPSRLGGVLCAFSQGKIAAYIPGGFPFVAARDIAQGHVLTMNHGRRGERYIFASEYRTMDDLMGLFEEVTGRKRPPLRLSRPAMSRIARALDPFITRFVPPERHRLTEAAVHILGLQRRADTSKAERELGFRSTSIREAVREAYDQFCSRGLIARRPSKTGASPAHVTG